MATLSKDFKVKNGLNVALDGIFGGTVTIAAPTETMHAATKQYVDASTGTIPVLSTPPVSPTNGQTYFDSLTQHINIYYSGEWIMIATLADSETLPQHIHDTAIDGTGFVVSRFYDAGYYNSAQATSASGGFYNTNSWTTVWFGGEATDNFN
jgi:hypothetical protein